MMSTFICVDILHLRCKLIVKENYRAGFLREFARMIPLLHLVKTMIFQPGVRDREMCYRPFLISKELYHHFERVVRVLVYHQGKNILPIRCQCCMRYRGPFDDQLTFIIG